MRSIVPVWVVALGGVVLLVAITPPGEVIGWFPVVLAAAVIVTFAIQLALPRKTGFVGRVLLSTCGAVGILALATVVLAAVGATVG